jgi:polyadenylate-binding protein
MAAGMPGGRGNPGFMNPQYMAAMGRGGPVGRGAPMNPQYMAAMGGRGMPMGMNPGMNPAAMAQYGMVPPQQRQQRQNRQRNGPMAGGPVGPGGPGGPRGGVPGMPVGAAQQQFKYATNTRNANGAGAGANGPTGEAPVQTMPETDAYGTAPLTIEQLSAASPAQQKQLLGEKLFPLIGEREPTLAGKITGMLLEMENSDILHLIDTPEALNEQVDEALTVLRAHGQGGEAAATPQAV